MDTVKEAVSQTWPHHSALVFGTKSDFLKAMAKPNRVRSATIRCALSAMACSPAPKPIPSSTYSNTARPSSSQCWMSGLVST